MTRTPVDSSQIASIGHNAENNELHIEFKSFGKPKPGQEPRPNSVYAYSNVPREVFDAFMSAESKGKFFGSVIKTDPKTYPYRKLNEEEAAQ